MFANCPRSLVHFVASMNRSEEVVDNEVSHVLAKALSRGEVKPEMDSGKYSAQRRLMGCGGEAAK